MILNFKFLRNWAIINYFFMFHIPSAWTIMYSSYKYFKATGNFLLTGHCMYKKEKINHDYNFSIFLIIQFV